MLDTFFIIGSLVFLFLLMYITKGFVLPIFWVVSYFILGLTVSSILFIGNSSETNSTFYQEPLESIVSYLLPTINVISFIGKLFCFLAISVILIFGIIKLFQNRAIIFSFIDEKVGRNFKW